jgi:hypothetical protein
MTWKQYDPPMCTKQVFTRLSAIRVCIFVEIKNLVYAKLRLKEVKPAKLHTKL